MVLTRADGFTLERAMLIEDFYGHAASKF